MQQPNRPPVSCRSSVRRSAIARLGLLLVAAGASFGSSAMAAGPAAACPAGQMPATRIEYEGKYNQDPTADVYSIHELLPNVGYTRRTVLVADGYYKETSEGTIGVVKDKPPGKPFPIPGADNPSLYARELPSRFVIVETPKQKLVYDEQGDPEQLGSRRTKSKQPSVAEQRMVGGALAAALQPSAGNAAILGKATYAGIPCEVRQFLMPGNSVCIARIRNQDVTLAEDMKVPKPSWMKAKSKSEVCVSARDFEPPASVKFK